MNAKRWKQIEQLYQSALGKTPECREAFLDAVCGNDEDLRQQVEALLAQHDSTLATGPPAWQTRTAQPETQILAAPGEKLGPYRIVSWLGAGGMGEVYRALDTRLGRAVAIKICPEQFGKRFELEARAVSALNHPNICTLYDVGSLPSGAGYMVTELVEGETLGDWLKRPHSIEQSLPLARQVLEALRAAHGARLVHRDLKPANIMVRDDGCVKVLDFGLAKRIPVAGEPTFEELATIGVSLPGQIVGTIAYMSPEQILGRDVDARSDLFAFGIILYEMLTGRHPWQCKSTVDTLHAILNDAPPPAEGQLGAVARKLLSRNPEDRYATAQEVLKALSEPELPASFSPGITRLIVLPFRILRRDEDSDFLAVSLPDAIASSLAAIDSIVVRSTMMASKLAAADFDVKTIAEQAQVDAILTGTLLSDGENLRVNAQLMRAPDGALLWSNNSRASLRDVFQLQDELVDKIVQSLALPLTAHEKRELKRDVPASAFAYELYLRANQVTSGGFIAQSTQNVLLARDLYLRSTQEDPNFAPAWVRLGRLYRMIGKYALGDLQENLRLADEAFQRAFALNPESALAHNHYTFLQADLGRSLEALERLLRRAQTHRNDPDLLVGLVHACRYSGLLEASIAAHQAARRLDKSVVTTATFSYLILGDRQTALELASDPFTRSGALIELGRTEDAIALLLETEKTVSVEQIRLTAATVRYFLQGDRQKSLEAIEEVLRLPGSMVSDPESHRFIGVHFARLNEPNRALEFLARALETGYNCLYTMLHEPAFDPLRSDPRFQDLVNRAARMTQQARDVFRKEGGEALLGIRLDTSLGQPS